MVFLMIGEHVNIDWTVVMYSYKHWGGILTFTQVCNYASYAGIKIII